MSFTIALSDKSSTLSAHFNPPIYLENDSEYVIGLTNFETFNTIPNIDETNNRIFYGPQDDMLTIPTGSYELKDIEEQIKNQLPEHTTFQLESNNNTLQSSLQCSQRINFTLPKTPATLLGFENEVLQPNVLHISKNPVEILKINALCIDCNIAIGSYMNGEPVHIIHQFFPIVPPGYKIVESPQNIIYFPVTVKTINTIMIKILDQDGDIVNFRGETVTVRLHLKKL